MEGEGAVFWNGESKAYCGKAEVSLCHLRW